MFAKRTAWQLEPNRLSAAMERHRQSGRELLDLSESNPTHCGFRYDEAAILSTFANPANLSYAPDPRGLVCAREAVAGYYRARGEAVDPEHIILTTSTSEGYGFLFRLLCDVGDEVLVPTPSYPLFEFLAGLHDVRLRPYELVCDHAWQIDFRSLRASMSEQSRAVMLVHPNNPTGSYVKPHERVELNAICAEHDIAIIADEVFLDYAHDGVARRSFATNQDVLTFTLSGLSKIAALPQMKVAWVSASGPEQMRDDALARLEVIADTYLSMNTPIQNAAPVLLEQRRNIVPQLLERVRANLGELDAQLRNQQLCQRLEI